MQQIINSNNENDGSAKQKGSNQLGALGRLAEISNGCITLKGLVDVELGDSSSDLRCEIIVHDKGLFRLALQQGVLGACESYLQGHWDCDDLTVLIRILSRNRHALDKLNQGLVSRLSQYFFRLWYWRRQNSVSGSQRNIADHYDLSVDLFRLFLDPNLMYSSAIYAEPENQNSSESLEQASARKLQTICDALALNAGDHLVEIGTGWGGFAIYAAENTGCKVTTTTISQEQYQTALDRVAEKGLQGQVTVLLKDYRELTGNYDKLVSIEMIEAVGHQYLDGYFATCSKLLRPSGKALIQAITVEDTRYLKSLKTVDYIKRYIFPGSFIPCNSVMIQSAGKNGLKLMSHRDIGKSYALTIKAWRERFNDQLPAVEALGFDQRFIRMWNLYFAYCEGGFAEGVISDVHLLFENSMTPSQSQWLPQYWSL